MLRTGSSRIGRGVLGLAALMLVATTCPTFGAPTTGAVESPTAAELATLPDTTLVKLKNGRTVTVGVLRSEHKARVQRFADAAKLGTRLLQTLSTSEQERRKASRGTLVRMDFSLKRFQSVYTLPADLLAFCKAAAATGCLYIPGGPLVVVGTIYMDVDNLITDQHLCTSEGGRSEISATTKQMFGCEYYYPSQYNLGFNPGKPTAHGYPVTHSASCPSRFVQYTVDPHGAVSLNVVSTNYLPNWGPLYSVKTCVVRVFVEK